MKKELFERWTIEQGVELPNNQEQIDKMVSEIREAANKEALEKGDDELC